MRSEGALQKVKSPPFYSSPKSRTHFSSSVARFCLGGCIFLRKGNIFVRPNAYSNKWSTGVKPLKLYANSIVVLQYSIAIFLSVLCGIVCFGLIFYYIFFEFKNKLHVY